MQVFTPTPQAMLAKPTTIRVASRRVVPSPWMTARRSLTILAAMQRAEYIWFDGSEGSPSKVCSCQCMA